MKILWPFCRWVSFLLGWGFCIWDLMKWRQNQVKKSKTQTTEKGGKNLISILSVVHLLRWSLRPPARPLTQLRVDWRAERLISGRCFKIDWYRKHKAMTYRWTLQSSENCVLVKNKFYSATFIAKIFLEFIQLEICFPVNRIFSSPRLLQSILFPWYSFMGFLHFPRLSILNSDGEPPTKPRSGGKSIRSSRKFLFFNRTPTKKKSWNFNKFISKQIKLCRAKSRIESFLSCRTYQVLAVEVECCCFHLRPKNKCRHQHIETEIFFSSYIINMNIEQICYQKKCFLLE